jgi:K+/H+ antiporter YhaU regulatory subunit KhtT
MGSRNRACPALRLSDKLYSLTFSKAIRIGQHTGALSVGINAPDGRMRINPSTTSTLSSVILGEGDVLIALGNEDQLIRLREFVRKGR